MERTDVGPLRSTTWTWPVLLVLAVASCTPDSGGSVPQVDHLPRLSYEENLRIGSLGDPERGFSRVGPVAVSESGQLYVLELQAREVRVFGPDGRRLGTIGGPGEGPGEFVHPVSLGLLADTVWVRDAGGRRISWFAPDGSLVHETPGAALPVKSDIPGMRVRVGLGDPRPDGFVGSAYSWTRSVGTTLRPFSVPVLRFDRDGAVVDTLGWDTIDPGPAPTMRIRERVAHLPTLRPHSPMVVDVGDDRAELRWSDEEGRLDMVLRASGGEVRARGALRYTPVPVPAHVRDSLLNFPEGSGRSYRLSDVALRAALNREMELPAHLPPLRTTRAGADGRLWIQLYGPSRDSSDWVVIDRELTPYGRLTLPGRMTPVHIDRATVWALELDEVDVAWLARLRVRPPDVPGRGGRSAPRP